MKIGVLALQGAFAEHGSCLDRLGIEHFQIRGKKDMEKEHDGIIIPGGESTVMAKLLHDTGLHEPVKTEIENGMPVFGTCAGLILLASHIEEEESYGIRTMDITAKRNAYGRQLGSFRADADFGGIGKIPMVFIRAPYITKAGKDVQILAVVNERMVAARQGNHLVTAFHPELTDDLRVHKYFADMIEG
ncbi:MAG: pyridoxal 5'-phosphate synthase glutaminase subunit PdxT [Muribaculaceae bacterium]|nr:pyridoxal 5'-phosphate synthase glutaminase subunit PdxT [Muribaculaceae bacterium]